MTFYYTVSTDESSLLVGNRPSADAIWNALDAISLPSGVSWVGPLARITRRNEISTRPFQTHVVRVLAVEGPYTEEGSRVIAHQVGLLVDGALGPSSGNWTATSVRPYDAAIDGALPAWQSGSAAVPRVEDTLPNSTGEIVESGLHRLGGALSEALQPAASAARNLTIAAAVGAVVVGAVLFWPQISFALGLARSIRRNPSRRRAKRR